MATIGYYEPAIFTPEGTMSPAPRKYTAGAGHTGTTVIQRADLVVLSSGTIGRAATNATANIAGLTVVNEYDVFNGTNTTPYDNQLFGFSQVGTLLPSDPGQIPVYSLVNNQIYLEMNLTNTTGWVTGGSQQVNLGSTVGIFLDATTNLFVLDPTQTNKIFTIYSKPSGPNKGVAGDVGARVVVYVNTLSAVV